MTAFYNRNRRKFMRTVPVLAVFNEAFVNVVLIIHNAMVFIPALHQSG